MVADVDIEDRIVQLIATVPTVNLLLKYVSYVIVKFRVEVA